MKPPQLDINRLNSIIEAGHDDNIGLIPLLQKIQAAFGYIPSEAIEPIATALNLFRAEVQGVITFYTGFSTEPKGKYVLKCCRGTACHVKGGRKIMQLIKEEIHLEEGETSDDYRFSLETAACLGACFLAPAMMVNQNYYGKLSPGKVTSVLNQHREVNSEKNE
jgi:NADH:ubiquinone oxidoreductase subunit E